LEWRSLPDRGSTLKKIRGVARHATKPLPLEVKR